MKIKRVHIRIYDAFIEWYAMQKCAHTQNTTVQTMVSYLMVAIVSNVTKKKTDAFHTHFAHTLNIFGILFIEILLVSYNNYVYFSFGFGRYFVARTRGTLGEREECAV